MSPAGIPSRTCDHRRRVAGHSCVTANISNWWNLLTSSEDPTIFLKKKNKIKIICLKPKSSVSQGLPRCTCVCRHYIWDACVCRSGVQLWPGPCTPGLRDAVQTGRAGHTVIGCSQVGASSSQCAPEVVSEHGHADYALRPALNTSALCKGQNGKLDETSLSYVQIANKNDPVDPI